MKRFKQCWLYFFLLLVGMWLTLFSVVLPAVRVTGMSVSKSTVNPTDTEDGNCYFVVKEAIPTATLQVNGATTPAAGSFYRNLTKSFCYFVNFQQLIRQHRCSHNQYNLLQRRARLVTAGLLTIWQGRINC